MRRETGKEMAEMIDATKAMEIETMRALGLGKLQVIKRGSDPGTGPTYIGITASQRDRRCRIGIDTNIESCR